MCRQEITEQRAVQTVNNRKAGHHIRPPQGGVFAYRLYAAEICSPLPRVTDDLGGGRCIAQT
jgi:hypothetical protein